MSSGEITQLLHEVQVGRDGARDELFEAVYRKLRQMARMRLGGAGPGRTLDSQGLVHEAYIKLVGRLGADWQDSNHFYAVACLAMRHIVVDYHRRKQAEIHGGGLQRTTLHSSRVPLDDSPLDILALDEALTRLGALDERLGQVVEMRFFGGLSVEETAEALNLTPRTIKRDWRKARAFLYRELNGAGESDA